MNKVSQNLIANYIGKLFGVFSLFFFIPLYIKHLGFDSYSIISLTMIIAGIVAIIDVGLSATILRELSRKDNSNIEKIKTYETFQIIFFVLAFISVVILFLFAPVIANSIKIDTYDYREVLNILYLAIVELVLQIIIKFYLGGLNGLEYQVLSNFLLVIWGLLRNAVVLLVIFFYPSLFIFFVWQLVVTLFFLILIKYCLDRKVYNENSFKLKINFDKPSFNKTKKFTGGLLLVSLISAISSQLDKILITTMFDIKELGLYTLVSSLSTIFLVVISPISITILPRMTEYFSVGNKVKFIENFNLYNLLISVIVFSVLSILVFFPKQILYVWLGDFDIAEKGAIYVILVSSGYALMVLQTMYYQVGLASAYIKINSIMAIVNLILIFPFYYLAGSYYGVVGIAFSFFIMQFFNYIIYSFVMNKIIIKEEYIKSIFLKSFIAPILISFLLVSFFKFLFELFVFDRLITFLFLGVVFFFVFTIVLLLTMPKSLIKIFLLNCKGNVLK